MFENPLALTGAVGFVVVAAAVAYLLWRRGSEDRLASSGRLKSPPKPAHASESSPPRGHSRSDDEDPLERSKILIHGLLLEVSENIDSLLDEVGSYDTRLVKHKAAIRKAESLAALEELERILLSEVESVQKANQGYRSELSAANERIKSQQQQMEKLGADATVDFLTKIPNRRALEKRLFEELARFNRHGSIFSLVMFDVDCFKRINDTLGHLAGDRVLRAVAGILGEEKRETDYLARYGGEEFALVLPETFLDQAVLVAQKIRRRVEASRFTHEGQSLRLTVSAGVSQVAEKGDSVAELVERTDAALYRAKERGRNRVEATQPDGAPLEASSI